MISSSAAHLVIVSMSRAAQLAVRVHSSIDLVLFPSKKEGYLSQFMDIFLGFHVNPFFYYL